MKKIISIVLCLMIVLSALTVFGISSSAANSQVLRTYVEANDGDILFLADFNDPAYKPNSSASTCGVYTPSSDGRELNIKGVQGKDQKLNFFGACFDELTVPADAKVTFVCDVKTNGTAGKNNSIGIGGWFIDAKGGPTTWSFYNEYGNWNSNFSDANRAALSYNNTKQQDYTTNIDAATSDSDGYITIKIEFDAAAKKMTSYYVKDNKWEKNNVCDMSKANDAKKDDCLGVAIYNFYEVVDTTVKNVKFFKGVGLTVEQTSIEKNTTSAITTTATTTAVVTTAEITTAKSTTKAVATTEATTTAAAAAADATEASGGCGSSVSLAAIAFIPVCIAAALPRKKRTDE